MFKCSNCNYRPNPADSVQYCQQPICEYKYGKNPVKSRTRRNPLVFFVKPTDLEDVDGAAAHGGETSY